MRFSLVTTCETRAGNIRKHVRCITGAFVGVSFSRFLSLSLSLSFIVSEVCLLSKLSSGNGRRSPRSLAPSVDGGAFSLRSTCTAKKGKSDRASRGAYVAFVFREANGHETTIDAPSSSADVCKVRESTKTREHVGTGNDLNVAVEARQFQFGTGSDSEIRAAPRSSSCRCSSRVVEIESIEIPSYISVDF